MSLVPGIIRCIIDQVTWIDYGALVAINFAALVHTSTVILLTAMMVEILCYTLTL